MRQVDLYVADITHSIVRSQAFLTGNLEDLVTCFWNRRQLKIYLDRTMSHERGITNIKRKSATFQFIGDILPKEIDSFAI